MNPKYKLNDIVKFTLDGKQYLGNVYIIDANGTFESPGIPSYDIMIKDPEAVSEANKEGLVLFKHITENLINE